MDANNIPYHPNDYWTKVAEEIKNRGSKNFLAGDDEPYYRYKRERFINLLRKTDFKDKQVLEVGCGPGGNLLEISSFFPALLVGVDISEEMINLATSNLKGVDVSLKKTDGMSLPFENESMDIVMTATVLQHNTDERMLINLVTEICRVSREQVVLFERIEHKRKGDILCEGRPLSYYENLLNKNGFGLLEVKYLDISVSYYVCGVIRKVFNSKSRMEGEPLSNLSLFLERILLPITKLLDKIIKEKRDVAKMVFMRNS